MIEFDKHYIVSSESGITDAGREAILAILYDTLRIDYNLNLCCRSCFDTNFDGWKFIPILPKGGDNSGCYGKLTTRLSKHCNQLYGIKLTAKELTILGNLINLYSTDANEISVDFTRDINWESGAFGDTGSCFWKGRKLAIPMLLENKAFAMRLWQNDRGVGRSWVWQHPCNNYIVFNGYGGIKAANGEHTQVETRKFAAIFADLMRAQNEPYELWKINLTNNGQMDGLLWINNGVGYMVGAKDKFVDRCGFVDFNYDFRWPLPTWTCFNCRRTLRWTDNNTYIYENNKYCYDCHTEQFRTCDLCNAIFPKSEIVTRRTRDYNYRLCNNCAITAIECYHCHNFTDTTHTIEVEFRNGRTERVCESHAYLYPKCLVCQKHTNKTLKRYVIYEVRPDLMAAYRLNPNAYQWLEITSKITAVCSEACLTQLTDHTLLPGAELNLIKCQYCDVYTNYILKDKCCPSCTNQYFDAVDNLKLAGLI